MGLPELVRQVDEVTVVHCHGEPNAWDVFPAEKREISGCRQGLFHDPLSFPSVKQKRPTKTSR